MDANRDDALQCIRLANKYLSDGNEDAARRLLLKGLRLDPHVVINGLEHLLPDKGTPEPARRPARRRSVSRGREAKLGEPAREQNAGFTKPQIDAVRKVLACKDYYDVLGVAKDCCEDELKKAYKLLALKFHPDKNHAPGATEAFKKIGTAFNILSDTEKRRRYDLTGSVEETPSIRNGREAETAFYDRGFDAEVFNMFFNSGFPFAQVYRGHRQRPSGQTRDSERESNYFVYIQLLPLLILFGLSFFSSLFVKDPNYNLSRTDKYSVERVTTLHHITYYVKPTFVSDYDGSVLQLEKQVEEDYVTNLRYRCYREKEHKENLLFRARYYGDDDGFRRATKAQTPSCERLVQVFGN